MQTLYLIDISGFIFRAFYALPSLTRADKTPVGAVYGFCNMLLRLRDVIVQRSPETETILWAGVFDVARLNFRHQIDPLYKSNRGEMPPELAPQFALIREACQAFGCPVCEVPGFEADDVIATYTTLALQKHWSVVIVSSDKDLMQLYRQGVEIYDPMKSKWIGEADIEAKFGVPPEKIPDVQALAGDTSDGITGVPGIGMKTAAELIRQFGSLESLLSQLTSISQKRRRELLQTHQEDARRALQLVTLRKDVDISLDDHDFTFPRLLSGEAKQRIVDFCAAQNFTGLQKRFAEIEAKAAAAPAMPVQVVRTSEDWKAFLKRAETSLILLQRFLPMKARTKLKPQLDGFIAVLEEDGEKLLVVIIRSDDLPMDQLASGWAKVAVQRAFVVDDVKALAHSLGWEEIPPQLEDLSLETYLEEGPTPAEPVNLPSTSFEGLDDFPKMERDSVERALKIALRTISKHTEMTAKLAEEPALKTLYADLDRPFVPVIYQMENRGIFVNTDHLEGIKQDLDQQLTQLQDAIFSLTSTEFNLASPQQLGQVLSQQLGIQAPVHRKTGNYQTDLQTLTKLAQEEGHPILPLLLEWRKVFKLRTTYTDTILESIHKDSHRIHSTFLLTNTNTGRLASQNPNLQNIPIRTPEGSRIREAFEGEGEAFLASFDYSQIELRLLAYLGEVKHLVEAFENHEDIHQATAARIFNTSPDAVTPDVRRMAKAVNFGILYGQTPFGLAQQLAISPQEAKEIIDTYFATYPEIEAYIHRCKQQAYDHGYVETLWKRRCYLPSLKSPYAPQRQFAERQAVNAPLQGTNADIMKSAMIALQKQLQGTAVHMVLQIHDELVFEGPKPELERLTPMIRATMEGVLANLQPRPIPLVVNNQIGKTWAEAHG